MAVRTPGEKMIPFPLKHAPASPYDLPLKSFRIVKTLKEQRLIYDLQLVCREWRQIALDVLYEIIHLSSTQIERDRSGRFRTESLLRTLQDSKDADMSYQVGYGRWVKQLTLDIHHCPIHPVKRIISLCPNLETLIMRKGRDWSRKQIDTNLREVLPKCRSLRRFEWLGVSCTRADSTAMSAGLGTLLQTCTSLRALTINCVNTEPRNPVPLHMPNLLELNLMDAHRETLVALAKWTLPSLTHLSIECCRNLFKAELKAIAQHFGSHLLFLSLRSNCHLHHGELAFMDYIMDEYVRACPRLQILVLPSEKSLRIVPSTQRSLTITHIILEPYYTWDQLAHVMRRILAYDLPALRCIWVLNGWDLRQPNSSRFEHACRARQIRVEDENGVDLLEIWR
ncbi:hypothetical protein A0H81_11794 [Grifola frondosa]|uniref:F-box domain-containing protein n=1 Tax=Grifola frondosa TaxID=5627 RepID=A0A1C7LU47_GRIFR|nr:hypothetical protein A0H81_11794 [Grifola frondosa]